LFGRKPATKAIAPGDVDVYCEYKVIDSEWGEDAELIEDWFEGGEAIQDDSDWIYWIDLYNPKAERSDLVAHWVRCLFDSKLPRPSQLKPA
jgi:hypothetical protein